MQVASLKHLGAPCYRVLTPPASRFGLIVAVAAVLLTAGPQPARAQFICDSITGGAAESGEGAIAAGSVNNFACGTAASATGVNSHNTASGVASNASGGNSHNTATGSAANATGNNSYNLATGNAANASGSGSNNVAIGTRASAFGSNTYNTAVGALAIATGLNASAFGAQDAIHANSAAFGRQVRTTRDNQYLFGNTTNTYTLPGIVTSESLNAQAVTMEFNVVTSNSSGDLAVRSVDALGLPTKTDLYEFQLRIDNLEQELRRLTDKVAALCSMSGASCPN